MTTINYNNLPPEIQKHIDPTRRTIFSEGTSYTEFDRKWFKKNPKRSYRLRRIFKNEFPPEVAKCASHVVIKQIEDGLRTKVLARDATNGEALDNAPNDDTFLMLLYERYSNTSVSGSFKFSDVFEQAELMKSQSSTINH